MSYNEALADNIRRDNGMYFPPCHKCGAETRSMSYIPGRKYTCQSCKLADKLADKERLSNNKRECKERKFAEAVKRIGKRANLTAYSFAINKVYEKLHTVGYFDSTEEILVAIELVKNKIRFRHQVKFNRYRLDFVLPDEKVVLEVDGVTFHNVETRNRERLRDDLIVLGYGAEWEVIRVTDKMVNENITKLLPAIKEIKRKRKELKEANGGVLPYWYTDR